MFFCMRKTKKKTFLISYETTIMLTTFWGFLKVHNFFSATNKIDVVESRAIWATFQSRLEKRKPLWKNFSYFSKSKFFLYFREWNFLALNLKNFIFQGRTFRAPKAKKTHSESFFHIFQKKHFLLFQEKILRAQK